jgi:hypothetical protein
MKTYHVEIEAQVKWETWVDADSKEEAKGFAVEEFESEVDRVEVSVELINSVTATEGEGVRG